MPVFKNESNGTWYVMSRYVNWKGERKAKMQAWICYQEGSNRNGSECFSCRTRQTWT